MKLIVDKIAKIDHAEIEFDGLTVIAGKNDTGKSTLGKILFATFNSLNDIENKISDVMAEEVKDIAESNVREALGVNKEVTRAFVASAARKAGLDISDSIRSQLNGESDLGQLDVRRIIESAISRHVRDISESYIDAMDSQIRRVFELPKDIFYREIVERTYFRVFNGQINYLTKKEEDGIVRLVIKNQDIEIRFSNNSCTYLDLNIPILHKTMFLSDPYIADASVYVGYGTYINRFMSNLLWETREDDVIDGIVSAVQAKEKLKEINELLGEVVPGRTMERDGKYFLQGFAEGGTEPLRIANLSTGIKSVFVLKRLLENGSIVAKDVIVFDEPEIHLHPEWQVLYAKIILLLEKALGLTVVITTHSPYFLYAIEKYTEKYNMESIAKYYSSNVINGASEFSEITGDLEPIYAMLARPFKFLESLDD